MNFLTCRYEIQQAKITIGPLRCQQEEEEPFNVEKEIKTLKEKGLVLQENNELINGTIQDVTNEIKTLKETDLELQENNELINGTIQGMKQEVAIEFSEIESRLEMLHPPTTTSTLAQLPLECSNSYNALTDSTRKYSYFNAAGNRNDRKTSSTKSSDWQGAGWYRVVSPAGTQISEHVRDPENKDLHGDCNTNHGGWMLGGHPTVKEGIVTRTTCARWDCVGLTKIQIRVVNCHAFYLYELKDYSDSSIRYCTQ